MAVRRHRFQNRTLPLASILVLAVLAAVVLLRGQGHAYRGDLSETTVSATEGEDPTGGESDSAGASSSAETSQYLPGVDLEGGARSVLQGYMDSKDCALARHGYLDLGGRVWSCVVQGDGWSEVCLVVEREGGCSVRRVRFDGRAWCAELGVMGVERK